MMRHENPSKPIPIGSNHNSATMPVASPNSGKRSIWRPRSTSEAPSSTPKSPITKAFDFLPWSRSRKSAAEKAAIASNTSTSGNKEVAVVESRDPSEECKKDCINYHRNIFRNGGGIIRDILGDKLNKERQQMLASDTIANNTLPNPHSSKYYQRRPKQVVGRNKSLDINELINCVENELAIDKKNLARGRFLDDTFIENIIRAKNEYQRRSWLEGSQQDNDYIYGNNYFGDELESYAESGERRKENNNRKTSNYSNNNNQPSPPSKHILFNDENVVYLIKKELPVKREMSKTKAAIEHNSRANQQKSTSTEKDPRKHERSTSVLRARLKFKKLTPPETTPQSEQQQQKHQSASQRSSCLQSKSVIDNCAIIGMASVGLSLMDTAGGGGGGSGSLKQSGGLQRQNTLPAAPPSHRSSLNVSDGHARHHQLYQRADNQHRQRRKSLTDTCFENGGSPCLDNSSSSSMGSGGGGGGGVGGGIISDRPKSEKPRKKTIIS